MKKRFHLPQQKAVKNIRTSQKYKTNIRKPKKGEDIIDPFIIHLRNDNNETSTEDGYSSGGDESLAEPIPRNQGR